MPICRESRRLVESTLSNINQNAMDLRESSQSLERRMSVLESCITLQNRLEREDSSTSIASITSRRHGDTIVRLGCATGHTPTHTTDFDRGSSRYLVANDAEKEDFEQEAKRLEQHGDKTAAPATPFELSSSFFPETYTSRAYPPALAAYALESVEETSYTRVSRCSAFYSPSSRRWLRITLSITTSCYSPYWDLVRFKTAEAKWVFHWSLPKKLNAAVQRSLGYLDGLKQDAEISFYLGTP